MANSIVRDITCPKCGYPETYQEVTGDGSAGCRRCGWRIRLDVLGSLTPAPRAAYFEALKRGQVYESTRGRLAHETPGRRQYSHHTIHRLRHLKLIERGGYATWVPVDTAATQWQVRDIATDELVFYVPTEREALRLVEGARHLTYAAPGHVPTPRLAPEKVAVELSRDDWKDVYAAVDAALSIRWSADPQKRARILAALTPATTKED